MENTPHASAQNNTWRRRAGVLAHRLFARDSSGRLPVVGRRLSYLLLVLAVLLLPWILFLGADLKGTAEVRMWSSTWIGLDFLEVFGLAGTGLLLLRRSRHVSAVAAFTATLFLVDVWFDVMLSQAGTDWYLAASTAIIFEIPLCLICTFISFAAPTKP